MSHASTAPTAPSAESPETLTEVASAQADNDDYALWFQSDPCGKLIKHDAHPWNSADVRGLWCLGEPPLSHRNGTR